MCDRREDCELDDKVIDLRSFLEGSPGDGEGIFALWGGDEDRVRLAVPVWRAIFLVEGDRGGVVSLSEAGGPPIPFFVLDVGEDPARTGFPSESVALLENQGSPAIAVTGGGGVAVSLGTYDDREWHLVVTGPKVGDPLEPKVREELLFLAGECAGLLFLRDAARRGTLRG